MWYRHPVFLRELSHSVTQLKGAGSQVAGKLARLGIFSVADLLLRYPRDYDDRSAFVPISAYARGARTHTIALVLGHEWFGYGRMRTLKLRVRDESAEAVLICFNRPFLEKQLPVGARILLSGKFQLRYGEIQASAFEVELLNEGSLERPAALLAGILPVYPLTDGLKQGTLRKLVRAALTEYGAHVEDELPSAIMARRDLLPKCEALCEIHFPTSAAQLTSARRSLVYEELFYFQLAVARRAARRRESPRPARASAGLLRRRLLERLPYALTPDQERSVAEIAQDMASPYPMARLLQGDVGSGKTLVALLACLDAIESGGQAAIMAPTELLARQHAGVAARLLEPIGIRLAFLSGNIEDAARPPLLAALKKGEVDLVLGTHALFSDEVVYRDLRLAVIDEQHRFGVLQRLALGRKGPPPDLLMMTATPIPRTLALTVYGDLALSVIRTQPPGRKPIITHLARDDNAGKVYAFVRRLLAEGRQAYFVYPLIGEGESERAAELKNAEAMARRLKDEVYPDYAVGLVHSRLKDEEKRRTMDAFVRGELKILVATSVIEVGVDVPNAAAMVVEHAERFGLAALHQLRGRVGRGTEQSYCFLVYSEKGLTEDGKARLKAMLETADGFTIAEEDLRIRGPGELAGTSQAGALRLTIADPVRDQAILENAREDAFALVTADPNLLVPENTVIREVLARAKPFGDAPVGLG